MIKKTVYVPSSGIPELMEAIQHYFAKTRLISNQAIFLLPQAAVKICYLPACQFWILVQKSLSQNRRDTVLQKLTQIPGVKFAAPMGVCKQQRRDGAGYGYSCYHSETI